MTEYISGAITTVSSASAYSLDIETLLGSMAGQGYIESYSAAISFTVDGGDAIYITPIVTVGAATYPKESRFEFKEGAGWRISTIEITGTTANVNTVYYYFQ